jgi:hypothetical protein
VPKGPDGIAHVVQAVEEADEIVFSYRVFLGREWLEGDTIGGSYQMGNRGVDEATWGANFPGVPDAVGPAPVWMNLVRLELVDTIRPRLGLPSGSR